MFWNWCIRSGSAHPIGWAPWRSETGPTCLHLAPTAEIHRPYYRIHTVPTFCRLLVRPPCLCSFLSICALPISATRSLWIPSWHTHAMGARGATIGSCARPLLHTFHMNHSWLPCTLNTLNVSLHCRSLPCSGLPTSLYPSLPSAYFQKNSMWRKRFRNEDTQSDFWLFFYSLLCPHASEECSFFPLEVIFVSPFSIGITRILNPTP